MSRTVKIKTKITSIAALQAAVEELKQGGLNCTLKENAKPRLWAGTSNAPVCEYMLELPGRFDIGFKLQDDGTYEAVADLHGGEIGHHVGTSCKVKDATYDQLQIGKLMQAYGKFAALEVCRNQGMPIEGISVGPDGSISITAKVMAMQA